MDNFFMYKKAVRAMDEINRVMEGKGHTVHQIMTAILAGGHILIEDIPGVGKTTLALAFSKVIGTGLSKDSVYSGYHANGYCRTFLSNHQGS